MFLLFCDIATCLVSLRDLSMIQTVRRTVPHCLGVKHHMDAVILQQCYPDWGAGEGSIINHPGLSRVHETTSLSSYPSLPLSPSLFPIMDHTECISPSWLMRPPFSPLALFVLHPSSPWHAVMVFRPLVVTMAVTWAENGHSVAGYYLCGLDWVV